MTTISLVEAIKTFIATYTPLSGKPLYVDNLNETPLNYDIVPLPGSQIVEQYLSGGSMREYPFAFQSMEYTTDELTRIASLVSFENFAAWLESQSKSGTLPTLNSNQNALWIQATGWGYLFQEGESGTGVYQINCVLQYSEH